MNFIGSLILQTVFRLQSVCFLSIIFFHILCSLAFIGGLKISFLSIIHQLYSRIFSYLCGYSCSFQYAFYIEYQISLMLLRDLYNLTLPVLHPWKLTMPLKRQKMLEEHVLLKPFQVQMLLESRNIDQQRSMSCYFLCTHIFLNMLPMLMKTISMQL